MALPANEQWKDGLILKVNSVAVRDGEVRLTGTVPTDPLEVYDSVSIQGTALVDVNNIVPAEGVTVRVVTREESLKGSQLEAVEDIKTTQTVKVEKVVEFTMEGLDGTISISIPEVSYDIAYTENELTRLYFEMPNEIVANVEVAKEFYDSKKIGTIPVQIGAGFSVEAILYLVYGVEGTTSIEIRLDNTLGVKYMNGQVEYVGEESILGKLFVVTARRWPIWNEENSIFKEFCHYEMVGDGKMEKIDACTYQPITLLANCEIALSQDTYTYDGTAKEPTITVKNGGAVVSPNEYTVSYSNNVEIGTTTIIVSAKDTSNLLVGTTTITFSIVAGKSDSGDKEENTGGEQNSIKYSGTEYGLSWNITNDGKLTVTGTCTPNTIIDWSTIGWAAYKSEITEAVMAFDGATDLSIFFRDYRNMESVDVKNLDTSKVTDMSYMFAACHSLKSLDLSNFDTNKVTNMYYMFASSGNLVNLNLSGWNNTNTKNMGGMFLFCENLRTLNKLTTMSGMFASCTNLTKIYVGTNWKIGTDINRMAMFNACGTDHVILKASL